MFYDRFKQLCDKRGISCNRAAIEMGLSNATPSQWKKKGLTPKADTLAIIANYFNVSVDYLLEEPKVHAVDLFKGCGGLPLEERQKNMPILTIKDERDIARNLEKIMADLENSGDLMFDGDPMSDEARESIRSALKLGLEAAKLKNKETYTPKKYRKG